MGHSPGERGHFRGAESRLQVGLCKWKAPWEGGWTGDQATPIPSREAKPWPCAPPPSLSVFQPPLSSVFLSPLSSCCG